MGTVHNMHKKKYCYCRTRSPEAILESGAKEKKRVYEQAVVERRGNFTPIVLSVDGLLHREAEHFLKRMAANLAHKWEKPYSQTCRYVRARLAFAIIRATSLCLRGSGVKWRSGLGMDDGAPLYSDCSCIAAYIYWKNLISFCLFFLL